jgi:hypothetical protein
MRGADVIGVATIRAGVPSAARQTSDKEEPVAV